MWIDAKEHKPDRHQKKPNCSVQVVLVDRLDGDPYVGWYSFHNEQWYTKGWQVCTPVAFYNFPPFDGMTFEFKILDYGENFR